MPKVFNVGIKGIIVQNNKALVLRNPGKNDNWYWDIPGGRMEEGEEFMETLSRELKEEINAISILSVEDVPVYVYKLPKNLENGFGLLLIFFKLKAEISEIILSSEHETYKWVSLEEVDDLQNMYQGYKTALKLSLE